MRQHKKSPKWFLGNRTLGQNQAQGILEFTTAAIAFIMLAFGMIQILRWAPKMLYEKTNIHDACMKAANVSVDCMGEFSATKLDATMP